jgi:hypothetical protein
MTARTLRSRLSRITRRLGWNRAKHDDWITGRVHHLLIDHHPWWDWGHPLMTLVGSSWGGNYQEPKPSTWWYCNAPHVKQRFTGFPRRRLDVVTEYDEFKRRTEGLNEDQLYEWKAINWSQDGELQLGHRYWGGAFYGLDYAEQRLVARYLRRWRRKDWYGFRTWLYQQGLHAAVYQRKPFSCGQPPPKGGRGYPHWLCQERRGHGGLHRFNSHRWGEIDGHLIDATYVPEVSK